MKDTEKKRRPSLPSFFHDVTYISFGLGVSDDIASLKMSLVAVMITNKTHPAWYLVPKSGRFATFGRSMGSYLELQRYIFTLTYTVPTIHMDTGDP